MNLLDVFIQRPILTWMLTLSMLVFGVLGYTRLGVDQFPKMEFPVVAVTATMEGASPEVMEEDVTDVLEEQINTISGVRELRSNSGQGGAIIRVEFELDRDIDIAAQDVRDKLARARRELPGRGRAPDRRQDQPLELPDHVDSDQQRAGRRSSSREYVRRTIKPKLETIEGVGGIQVFGRLDRQIRIWLDGEALRARGLAASDVMAALRREHVEIPGGLVESREIEYSVKTDAEYRTLEELERMVVTYADGAPVLLKDVARVEDGHEDQRTDRPLRRRAGGGRRHPQAVRRQHRGHRRRDPPAHRQARGDAARRHALQEGRGRRRLLASRSAKRCRRPSSRSSSARCSPTLTVFVFLRRWRPTLIVGLAIPVSLVTTFGFMWALGYTLNTMTLLAMTLGGGRRDRRRHRRAREHRAASRPGPLVAGGGLEGHAGDRLRGHGGHALHRGGVRARDLRRGHRRELPRRVRRHRRRSPC